jgi:anthranilate 1,2-dioxygenase small subunit
MNIELLLKVQDLNARYGQSIDDDKLEAWPDFFTEDGRYRVTTAENFERGLPLGMIYATSRAMLRDRVHSLRDANVYEAQRYRHLIGPPLIAPGPLPNPPPHSASSSAFTRVCDALWTRVNALMPGEVRAQSSFMVARIMHTGETTLFATGRYLDRVVLDGAGAARFAEKIVILDSRLIDTLLAIPL